MLMNENPHAPCVMTSTEDFYVRLCGCGVVHLSFGSTVLNLSPQVTVAITETLKELSENIRSRQVGEACGNVIRGPFRERRP